MTNAKPSSKDKRLVGTQRYVYTDDDSSLYRRRRIGKLPKNNHRKVVAFVDCYPVGTDSASDSDRDGNGTILIELISGKLKLEIGIIY